MKPRKVRCETGKITYIVYCPWNVEVSGGQVALHTLVKNLADAGEIVYVLSKPMFSCNAKTLGGDFVYEKENTVIIYPEIIQGNPLEAKHVVRWILYDTNPNVESTWKEDDELWYYNQSFRTSRVTTRKILTAFSIDKFKVSKGKMTTERNALLFRKKTPVAEYYSHPKDCYVFGEIGTIQEFVDKVKSFEFFYTYDDATFYSVIAAMCGCVSVILNPSMDAEEFREKNPILSVGIAYGNTEEEIIRARQTLPLVKKNVQNLLSKSIEENDAFRKHWKEKIL